MASDLFSDGVKPGTNDVIIALMGMTGAGKSSLISLCSEKKPVIGHDLNSCTQSVDTYPFVYDGPPKKRVILVDTPGFDDSTRSDAEVLRELAAWLTATYAKKIRLSGIIYLHRINQPRMQGSARKNIMMFKKLCGDNALQNVILATTMWDLVDEDVGAAREKQLINTKEFWGYMTSKGSKTYRHDNTDQSAMKLIGHFVKTDSKMTLEIQEEMVDQHKSLDGTAAAATVEAKLEHERARFAAELRNLEIDLREAIRQKDNESMEALREERAKYMADLAEIKAAQESLRTTMEKLHEERYAQPEEATKEQQKVHQVKLATESTNQTSRSFNIEIAASGSTDKLASADRTGTINLGSSDAPTCVNT
ncbi:P-loop containing nucleoside triphosphate hydrolase protein [Hypoxylon sp. NC1633]|nr:P-loop containing nucleoside triphosphate hydrolase protein [Hypoxylon sp. NC1633]